MGSTPVIDQHRKRGFRAPALLSTGVRHFLLSACARVARPVLCMVAILLIVSSAFVLRTVFPTSGHGFQPAVPQAVSFNNRSVPPLYQVAPIELSKLPNRTAVERAVQFILRLQPQGSYILTTAHSDDVVHMDVAHSAIALTKVGHIEEAKRAMDWLLAHMTMLNSPDRFGSVIVGGKRQAVDYAGSWYDHFRVNGEPRKDLTRGRGEGVGISLIAIYTIFQDDPTYISQDGRSDDHRPCWAGGALSSEPSDAAGRWPF